MTGPARATRRGALRREAGRRPNRACAVCAQNARNNTFTLSPAAKSQSQQSPSRGERDPALLPTLAPCNELEANPPTRMASRAAILALCVSTVTCLVVPASQRVSRTPMRRTSLSMSLEGAARLRRLTSLENPAA